MCAVASAPGAASVRGYVTGTGPKPGAPVAGGRSCCLSSPERVAEDVREEKLSLDYARREYGVVIDPQTLVVDAAATAALRRELTPAP